MILGMWKDSAFEVSVTCLHMVDGQLMVVLVSSVIYISCNLTPFY